MKNVTIYSTPGCVYCKMAKNFFEDNNIQYTEYDLSTDAERREEMIKKTGQMAVPIIDIDGEIAIGFDQVKLSEMLGL